jgi:hypothetical protein
MKSRLFLDVVIRQGSAVLKLLPGEDKTLLIRGDTFLVLDLSLYIINGITRLDIKSDGLKEKKGREV